MLRPHVPHAHIVGPDLRDARVDRAVVQVDQGDVALGARIHHQGRRVPADDSVPLLAANPVGVDFAAGLVVMEGRPQVVGALEMGDPLEHPHALLEAGQKNQQDVGFHGENVKSSVPVGKRRTPGGHFFSGLALMKLTTSFASQKQSAVKVSAAP